VHDISDSRRAETRAEFLERRRHGIGGSDAAAILGESPFSTALDVYLDKVSPVPDDAELDYEFDDRKLFGNLLEPIVVGEVLRRKELMRDDSFEQILRGDLAADSGFMKANVDAIVVDDDANRGVLEVKTAHAGAWRDWQDGAVPLHYQIQMQHYLAVTDLRWGIFGALIGGNKLVISERVPRNDTFIEAMVARETEFWDRVQRREPPDPTFRDVRALDRLYKESTKGTIALPPESTRWADNLEEARQELSAWNQVKDTYGNKLRAAIGRHSEGELPDGRIYTWRRQKYTPARYVTAQAVLEGLRSVRDLVESAYPEPSDDLAKMLIVINGRIDELVQELDGLSHKGLRVLRRGRRKVKA
jgi:putative phage-type endonuclease